MTHKTMTQTETQCADFLCETWQKSQHDNEQEDLCLLNMSKYGIQLL